MIPIRIASRFGTHLSRSNCRWASGYTSKTDMTVSYTTKVHNSAECIDLRSDTVTLPPPEMRQAMANALLGDDVYGEDPTVNALEERCASLFGKESAIFVVSGTMANLLAVLSHCQRGEEIIVGKQSHIHRWEQGNYAQIGGISANLVDVVADGTLPIKDIEASIRGGDSHMPYTKLICIENTHNYAGGKALPKEYLEQVRSVAVRHGLRVHMDGARVYNAAVKTGMSLAEIASYTDSLMMCFSKGLGAPTGSILVGTKEFIQTARWRRKAIGGGWRQAGVLAAAAMMSLDRAELTINTDHAIAKSLSRGLNELTPPELKGSLQANEEGLTNIIVVKCANGITPPQVVSFFHSHNILVMAFDETRVRIVTNWGVNEEKVKKVLEVYEKFVKSLKK